MSKHIVYSFINQFDNSMNLVIYDDVADTCTAITRPIQ